MNYFTQLFLISILAVHISTLPRIGCRDNSQHCTTRYDYKQDHAVACLCACPDTLGRCLQCGHYHEPKPWTIVQVNSGENKKTTPSDVHDPLTILKKLVKQYHHEKIKG